MSDSHLIDHIVIGARTRSEGQAAVEPLLGVDLPLGGEHPAMGTHNCVMQAGGQTYFELIAVNPEAAAPSRPRWFSLDDEVTMNRLAERPRALCWVVSVPDLDQLVRNSPVPLGRITEMSRGTLNWRLTITDDGMLPQSGLVPVFIEWPDGINPSHSQQDKNVRLETILLSTPQPDTLQQTLTALGCEHLATITKGDPSLRFEMSTPRGRVILD